MRLNAIRQDTHVLFAADVAGVDAQLVNAVFHRLDGELVIEMDIGDQRNGAAVHQARTASAQASLNGYADDVRARDRQRANLGESVFSTSAVSVLVIDCTLTGAPPPMRTLPT